MESKTSPFLLIFRDAPAETYRSLSAEQRQQLLQRWNAWYDGLAAEGKVEHGHPLEPQVRLVSGSRGERVVDGPFAEAKESIGGYFFLQARDLAEATAIARQCPSLSIGLTVEIRAVAEFCATLGVRARPAAKAALGPA